MSNIQSLIREVFLLMYYWLAPLLLLIALLVFLWGLMRFIFNLGSEAKTEEGKNLMIWGVISLFVMVAVWGLVRFIQSNLDITNVSL